MTQEDKKLLLVDLCARLPYGTIVSVTDETIKYKAYIKSVSYKNIQVSPISDSNFTGYIFYKISKIKPYLRPMSNMTEEERKELENEHPFHAAKDGSIWNQNVVHVSDYGDDYDVLYKTSDVSMKDWCWLVDWLNAHHFDFRNLIERGLAIDCTGLNVY